MANNTIGCFISSSYLLGLCWVSRLIANVVPSEPALICEAFRAAEGNRGPTRNLFWEATRKANPVRARRSQLIKQSELGLGEIKTVSVAGFVMMFIDGIVLFQMKLDVLEFY
jgi:hypothetical protein